MEKRVISTQLQQEDEKTETSLRPQKLKDYIGQKKAKENLKVYIEAAKQGGIGSRVVLRPSRPGKNYLGRHYLQ